MNILDITMKIKNFLNADSSFQKFVRFNPSILHLEDNKYAVAYRIWKSDTAGSRYPRPWTKGSPWMPLKEMWRGLNDIGFAVIEVSPSFKSCKLLFNQVIEINVKWFNWGPEDPRLFRDARGRIKLIFGLIRYGNQFISKPNIKGKKKVGESFLLYESVVAESQSVLMDHVHKQKPISKKTVKPSCVNHTYSTEKNWMPLSIGDKNYTMYFSYPNTVPIYIYQKTAKDSCMDKIAFQSKSFRFGNLLKKVFPDLKVERDNDDLYLANTYGRELAGRWNQDGVAEFTYLGRKYLDNFPFSRTKPNGMYSVVRLGGGSPLTDFNGSELIGTSHVVLDCAMIYQLCQYDLLPYDDLPSKQQKKFTEIAKNLANRPVIRKHSNSKYRDHHLMLSYYTVFFTVRKSNPAKIHRISGLYNFAKNNKHSGLVFPVGITPSHNSGKWVMSAGFADNRSILVEMSHEWLDQCLVNCSKFSLNDLNLCDVIVPDGQCRAV